MPVTREVEYLPYLYTCNRCRSCTVTSTVPQVAVCPAYQHRHFFAYSGGGKAYAAQGVIEKQVPVDVRLAEVAFTCQLCGACMALCPPQFDTVSIIRDLRDHVVGKGIFLNAAHRRLVENLRATGSPWGMAGHPATASGTVTPAEEEGGQASLDGQTLLYAGCTNRHSTSGRLMFASIRKLLDRLGIDHALLGESEPACGCFELALGLKRTFPAIAEATIARLNELGPEMIVTTGASCGWAFGRDFVDIGDLEPATAHVTEVVAERLRERLLGSSALAAPVRVTYHDPCALGRGAGVYDPPREILASLPGVEIVEMRRSRAEALCCGAGFGMREMNPEFASFTASERARDVMKTGADTVVTTCGACVDSLRDSLARAGSGATVTDLYGFVLDRTTAGG